MLFKLLRNDVNGIGKALTEVESIQQTFFQVAIICLELY